MVPRVEDDDPTPFGFLGPFGVVVAFTRMKVEQVVCNQEKLVNSLGEQWIRKASFHLHHIVVDGIVPFANKLQNDVALLVVREDLLHEERLTADAVPLGMNDKIVHAVVAHFGRALLQIKRASRVLRRAVTVFPSGMWS